MALFFGAAFATGAAAKTDVAVRIVAPLPESTVHDNSGNVSVQIEVSPALDKQSDDLINLLVDGQVVARQQYRRSGDLINLVVDGKVVPRQQFGQFKLTGLARGAHTLEARITAPNGKMIAASTPLTFYMWEASRLFPNRR